MIIYAPIVLYSVYRTTYNGTKDQQIKIYSSCENWLAESASQPIGTLSDLLTQGLA
jgi:hypothetical protein